jgi:anti-sigma-K factor RskA
MSDHERWEELAAGHALSALEPEEEVELADHLAGCTHCREVLADHAFVAAQLGTLVDTSDAPSWEQIRGGVLPAREVVSLEEARSRRRAPVWISAAAAAVLVLAGLAVTLRPGSSENVQQVARTACSQSAACHVVNLQDRGSLLVQDGAVKLLPTRLGAAPAGQVYVLWQLPRDGRPTLVSVLSDTRDGVVGERHALALPYDSTAAFGLSVEPASSLPTQPTKVLAVGTA